MRLLMMNDQCSSACMRWNREGSDDLKLAFRIAVPGNPLSCPVDVCPENTQGRRTPYLGDKFLHLFGKEMLRGDSVGGTVDLIPPMRMIRIIQRCPAKSLLFETVDYPP